MKSFLKAGFALLALQSLAFGAGGLLVNKAKTDWTPQDGGKVTMTKINGTMQAISFTTNGNKDGENYIMDVVLPEGLGHGGKLPPNTNAQQFTFAFQNPKQVSDESKVGYLEVIVDLSSAKSIPASITKKDETIKNNIKDDKVTSPEVYGQYKDNGIGFYMYSQKHASNEYRDGTNFGKCKNEIRDNKLNSTAKQFKIVIPDNLCTKQGNKETCKDNNYATLIFATDTFYRGCKKEAKDANSFNDSKSNFFGIRLSVKHSTEKYAGSSLVLNNMSYNSGLSSGAGTYNLPTLIIGREEELPELCTPGMLEANKKASQAGRPEPYECNFNSQCVKTACPGLQPGKTCWNCTGGTKKKQLLWAACGESDIKDEMDCRKTAANCEGRIGKERSRNYDLNFKYLRVKGDEKYEYYNFRSVNDDANDFWGNNFYMEFARCYSNEWGLHWGNGPKPEQYERKDSIYSSGYRWTYGNWRHIGTSAYKIHAGSSWNGIPCVWSTTLNGAVQGWYEYEIKTPKLFTISLREYANRNKDNIDHDKIPAFEAKFKIVNASTEVGTKVDDGLPYHEYTIKKVRKSFFKNGQISCYFLNKDGKQIGTKNNEVKVKLYGTEDEPTFTINTRDKFSPSDSVKGMRIQCRFDLSDIEPQEFVRKDDYLNNKGLYNEFAYNIQLVSLKILNTAGANYKDLSLNTKCSFATRWKSRPARVGGQNDTEPAPWRYIITDEFEYSYDSHQNADRAPKSKQRHFRFDARPLFYAANPVNDNNKLYAGYKYPEDKTKERALNPEEDLKYLSDKTANDKLIEKHAIFFPKDYRGNVAALDIDAKDAEGKPIKGFTSSLTGVIASIYARDDELEFKQLPSIYSTNNKNNTGTTQKLYNQIENCFNDNICQAVWADLKPKPNPPATFTANAFVYSDIVNGDKYLAYNNYGKTLLRLGDSEQTTFSQNNKTTHSDDPEPLCDVGEAKSTCDSKDKDCKTFRKGGGLYGCDTIVVNNSKAHNLQNMPADFERKGVKFYTFNPAMMKINTTLSNKSASNSPYNSEKFTYHRAPCSSYPDSTNCNDELENATFTIQVGAAGANKANILANNFLSRYDGQAKAPNDPAEDNIEFRSGLVTPVVVHPDNRNVNNPISTNEFRFKITSEQFKTMSLLLAPRCDTMKLGYSGWQEVCQKGDAINENNYIARAENSHLVPATKKMHNTQTHYQNLLAGASQNGVLDLTIFKTGFTKGVADLKNIDRTTNPKKDLGLLFGQKASEYSLKEKEPVLIKTEAKKVEVPDRTQEPKNQWLEDNKISAMVDATGGAAILDVVLVAPNKQVGGKAGDLKDNAVFLAAYTSNPLMAKDLQDAKIIGDIIPGYANYYRIRRDAFPALNAKLFEYSVDGADIGANNITAIGQNEQSQKQSGDFLKVPAGKNINVKLMDPDAQMYCNFIRNCYPLPNGAGYGAIFTGFESKSTDWKGGSTIIDEAVNKAKTRPTQRRIAW